MISEASAEIQTERGVPGRDGRSAVMKALRLKAEYPLDNMQDKVHHLLQCLMDSAVTVR